MPERALVVGAGVAGLCCALALSRRGFSVTLIGDPAQASASTVAAGMLAPAAEATLDPDAPAYALLADALTAWPGFAASIGATGALHPCGTVLIVAATEPVADLRTDARVDISVALKALVDACAAAGVHVHDELAGSVAAHSVTLNGGATLMADVVVLAAGWRSQELASHWPESARLAPVRGQLVRFEAGAAPDDGPMIRLAHGYLCPSAEGVVSGATMETGVADAPMNPDTTARQVALARQHFPSLRSATYRAIAGVRADTPDHLPLVGRLPDGALVATGFRRNGWLLAPLAAKIIAAYAAGEDPGPWADALAPARFSR